MFDMCSVFHRVKTLSTILYSTATFLLLKVYYLYGVLPPLRGQQIISPSEMVTDDIR